MCFVSVSERTSDRGGGERGAERDTHSLDKVLQTQLDGQGRLADAAIAQDHELVQHHATCHDCVESRWWVSEQGKRVPRDGSSARGREWKNGERDREAVCSAEDDERKEGEGGVRGEARREGGLLMLERMTETERIRMESMELRPLAFGEC